MKPRRVTWARRQAKERLEGCLDRVGANSEERRTARRLFDEIADHPDRPSWNSLVLRVMRDLRVGREASLQKEEAPVARPAEEA